MAFRTPAFDQHQRVAGQTDRQLCAARRAGRDPLPIRIALDQSQAQLELNCTATPVATMGQDDGSSSSARSSMREEAGSPALFRPHNGRAPIWSPPNWQANIELSRLLFAVDGHVEAFAGRRGMEKPVVTSMVNPTMNRC